MQASCIYLRYNYYNLYKDYMKIQDMGFLVVFLAVLWTKNSRIATLAGLLCLILAIPLFAAWIFFTAERLTWYAAAFLLLSIALSFKKS